MMTSLADLFDPTALDSAIAAGYVRAQTHPTLPLRIFNYTEKAQFENVWTPVTLACRGLIVAADGAVVARPMPKFFNYGQTGAPALDITAPARVTDKADGSLGVLFPTPDGPAVATRGSFASDQARHATAVLRARYPSFVLPGHLTVLVEIIYPMNRIVIDYAGLDDLVLLGAVDVASGRTYGPEAVPGWPGPVIDQLPHATLAEALAAPPRDNREGLVVWLPDTDVRVKIKYEEYVRLHYIVSGVTARAVWEALVAGRTVADYAAGLPDEFHPWVTAVAAELTASVDARAAEIERLYDDVVAALPEGWGRKEFALVAATHPERGPLFMRLDGRDYRRHLWDRARPEADWTPFGRVPRD
jgi:RNA ligase